jgi:hypothetical protein
MKRTLTLLTALIVASAVSTACTRFDSTSDVLLPTSPGSVTTAPTAPAPPPGSGLGGTWASILSTVPSAGSCANFVWQVSNATPTSMSGNFSATCAGNITIAGNASGQLVGTTVPLTITGTATYAGAVSCDFSLSGTGVIENNDTLTIPYSGTTCFGPVSGTQQLHRPSPAAPPPAPPAPTPDPPAAPGDPIFGCGGIADHLQLVECIWDHIHPTDAVTAFEVTKRVAWALRGEGAGDLIKNGGENIVSWRGYSFSASRIVYPDGRLVKVIYDAGPGGVNGPSWQDGGDYVDRSLYVPAIDPSLP